MFRQSDDQVFHLNKKARLGVPLYNDQVFWQALPLYIRNETYSEPLMDFCPIRRRLVLSRNLFGKDKVAHGRATEASADHSIFTTVQAV